MKRHNHIIALICLLVILLLTGCASQRIPLEVPSVGIRVDVEYTFGQRDTQRTIDREDTAAWWAEYYIGDHNGQGFYNLWEVQPGDEVIFGNVHYTVSYIITGWSINGVTDENGDPPPKAELYLLTCLPGGENYQIIIVGIEKQTT